LKEIKSNPEENTKKKQSSLKRIGNFIKEARLSRDQSVEELASDLKIGSHQLKAIEEGNEEELPEKVFIKAMVRRISQKLKLDTEFIMNEFKTQRKEVKIEEIVEEVSKKNNTTRQSKKLNQVEFGIFILISGSLGLIASSFIFNLFSESSYQNQTPKQELIKKRDFEDSNREISPLIKANDAIEIITDGYSINEVVDKIIDLYNDRIPKETQI